MSSSSEVLSSLRGKVLKTPQRKVSHVSVYTCIGLNQDIEVNVQFEWNRVMEHSFVTFSMMPGLHTTVIYRCKESRYSSVCSHSVHMMNLNLKVIVNNPVPKIKKKGVGVGYDVETFVTISFVRTIHIFLEFAHNNFYSKS